MLSPLALAAVCLASSTVWAAYVKPNYKVDNAENLFKDFVKDYNKIYEQGEYSERLEIFKETLIYINELNTKFPNTVFAINYFADLKPSELQQYYDFKLPNKNITEGVVDEVWLIAPRAFDWRKSNVVTPVKNQGKCAASYIFSAVGNIEGQYAIKYELIEPLALSEGQVLDCLDYSTCNGGYMGPVMQELANKKKKLETDEDYPYKPYKRPCREETKKGRVQVTNAKEFTFMNEEKLKAKLVNYGPLSIAINIYDLIFYYEGILDPDKCTLGLNHAVLLVGYGEEHGIKYWIIKNSWGTGWGEDGYVRLLRGVNACGIGSYVAVSIVA